MLKKLLVGLVLVSSISFGATQKSGKEVVKLSSSIAKDLKIFNNYAPTESIAVFENATHSTVSEIRSKYVMVALVYMSRPNVKKTSQEVVDNLLVQLKHSKKMTQGLLGAIK